MYAIDVPVRVAAKPSRMNDAASDLVIWPAFLPDVKATLPVKAMTFSSTMTVPRTLNYCHKLCHSIIM